MNATNDASATKTTQHPLPLDTYAILHIRPGPPWPEPGKTPQIAADAPFELSSDIWIERFEKEFAINIQRACEPANHNIDNHVWDRHLYAFVRRETEEERRQRQQPGTVVRDEGIIPLFTVIALSRLVRPTTVGNRYCAKIYPTPATDPVIQALTISGANVVALLQASELPFSRSSCRRLSPRKSSKCVHNNELSSPGRGPETHNLRNSFG